ncbi:GIY-YIG nuclease family protein [Psychrobacter sp. B29-1]|uniref:GIY-YIG nuclease family protein n=1 Tax=Psychrobacter sp. B29-1 TaxID=1867800 RepID=UPI0025D71F88|nr:GIY-YIG nuclease family protein [Psychrobacter sp. B29-1]
MTKQNCTSINPSTQVKRKSTRNKRYTNKEYIEAAIAVHGDYFGYDKVEYITSKVKVEIYCPHCQDYFWQGAGAHLGGYGCGRCRVRKLQETRRVTIDGFIEKAVKKHGNKYNYEKVVYKNSTSHVTITCPKHGDFKQAPSAHVSGNGCRHCRSELVSKMFAHTSEDFFKSLKGVHKKGHYSYEKAVYTRSNKKIIITCSVHGDFSQQANDHKLGRGCAKCGAIGNKGAGFNRTNFKKSCNKHHDGFGYLYVIKCHDEKEVFYKIGITSVSLRRRLTGNVIPYNYDVLYDVFDEGNFIFDMETQLHRLLKKYKYEPKIGFGGQTECFTTIKPIEKLLKELSTTEQLQLLA